MQFSNVFKHLLGIHVPGMAEKAEDESYSNPLNSTPALPYPPYDQVLDNGDTLDSLPNHFRRLDMDQTYKQKLGEARAEEAIKQYEPPTENPLRAQPYSALVDALDYHHAKMKNRY